MRTILPHGQTAPLERGRRRRVPACRAILFLGLLGRVGSLAGCGTIEPVAPYSQITDPTHLYVALTLDHPAVTLDTAAGYRTLQLTATPRDALGNPMPGLPAPVFTSLDTAAVQVTADGLVMAVQATTGARVVADLTTGQIRHTDTAMVAVTALSSEPPALTSLSIHPVGLDSAVWSMPVPLDVGGGGRGSGAGVFLFVMSNFSRLIPGGFLGQPPLVARPADAIGNPIAALPIAYTSLNAEVATIDRYSGQVTLRRTGSVGMVAQTTAYGVTKADTATFTVTTPILAIVNTTRDPTTGAVAFFQSSVRIAPYGVVSFTNLLDDSVDVTFDDPTTIVAPPAAAVCSWFSVFSFLGLGPGPFCGPGNVLLLPRSAPIPNGPDGSQSTIQIRQFPVPGIYHYHSVRTGATGRIVVDADYVDE